MLYVFHVDTGRMLKFDMNAALSSVENLKEIIERLHGLPAKRIVLLVSGGEVLAPKTLVCSYSAGTDTNPIYMFYAAEDKKQQPGHTGGDTEKDQQKELQKKPIVCNVSKNQLQEDWIESRNLDLREQVDHCLALPATYSTVSERAKLAAHLHELAREEENICAQLVLEQHLQQQGWAAVIANMEDLTIEYRQRTEIFFKCFDDHFKKGREHLELLYQFNDDLEQLAQIPILPGLMENAEERFRGFDEYLENDEVFSNSQQNVSMIRQSGETNNVPSTEEDSIPQKDTSTEALKSHNLTLLQWISAKRNHHRLMIMAQECITGIESFKTDELNDLITEVRRIIELAEKDDIREIKGLSERLSGLENLMYELKQKVKEQKDLSIAFQQNQNRASNLGDPSVLPDLCASHRSQLIVMVGNQKLIRDIRRRISNAKDELRVNLEMRLKYIATLENCMSDTDSRMLFFHQCLSRLEKHMNIIQQIHQTPSIYVHAVTEVVRRRIFSGEFVKWASTLANDFFTIHNAEIMRRQEFNTSFEGHFLNTLFPGLDDMPPCFNNESSIKFDSNLPNLTKSDIETLSKYLPDITSSVHLPDMATVIEFFVSRSGIKSSEDKSSLANKLQSAAGGTVHRPIDIHAHLKDGFESETDTEEFEKVGQSANERQVQCTTTTMATSTSENICEKNSISTSTEARETNTISTLTEVPETNTVETLTEISAPKKPPRFKKPPKTSISEIVLPDIFDQPVQSNLPNFSISLSHAKSSTPNSLVQTKSNQQYEIETVGHQVLPLPGDQNINNGKQGPNLSPSSPYPINNILIDNEFINSEFYIDESLPSSLNDDDTSFKEHTTRSYSDKFKDELFTYPGHPKSSSDESIAAEQTLDKSTLNKQSMETVFGLLQENLGSTRLEVEKLKSLLKSMSDVSYQCLNTLKTHLQSIKSDAQAGKNELQTEISKLTECWNSFKSEYESHEQETFKRLSSDYEKTISDIQKNLSSKEEELVVLLRDKSDWVRKHTEAIANLESQRGTVTEEVTKLNQQIEALQLDLKKADLEKEKAVNECRERLIHEHKTEIESLRCRFKLMTSMDRSPSDTSLEKIEKPDMIEFACHESILNQMKQDLNIEKEMAIKAAVEEERCKWIGPNSNYSGAEFYKLLIEEKDKQLDVMRHRDTILTAENNQLKLRLQALTTEEETDKAWLKEKLDLLNKDKTRLELELNVEKSKRIEMESSFAILKGSNPEWGGVRSKMSSSQLVLKQSVSTESCAKGEVVFVVWSIRHRQFTVVQDSASLYFVHADSLPALNLSLPDPADTDIPVPFFALGRVLDKEYCLAKKDTNRYRVTMGTKFYRIKLLPLSRPETTRLHHKRERYESASSTSSSVSRSTSTQHLIDTSAQTESPIVPSTSRDMVDSASLKERTTSFTSVAEEDDEPVSLLSERCRYISLSEAEEDDKAETTEPDCAITTNISTSTTTIASTSSTNQPIPTESSSEKDQDDSDEYRSLEAKDEEPYFPLVL